MDDTIMTSILEFISFHKLYAYKRKLNIKIFIFLEHGISTYHKDIYKYYKSNREQSKTTLSLDVINEFKKIYKTNIECSDKIFNRIPNVHIIRLQFLEADFMPYYIRKRILGEFNNDIDIIYSTDKDMLQCLDNSRTFVYYRHNHQKVGVRKILNRFNAFAHYLKTETSNIDIKWFDVFLAIQGDVSDGIPPVQSGFGIKRIAERFEDIIKMVGGSREVLFDNIRNKRKLFVNTDGINDKYLLELINKENDFLRNLKLCSYELISDYVDGGFPAQVIEIKRNIENIVNNPNKIKDGSILFGAIKQLGLTNNLTEELVLNSFLGGVS